MSTERLESGLAVTVRQIDELTATIGRVRAVVDQLHVERDVYVRLGQHGIAQLLGTYASMFDKAIGDKP
ncbi:hypothetical protein SAMN04490240_4088 [Rhodococcus pyridinivorans]|uniref:hypothetical protein n=1 Tax=Rhodococcus pyridinivorans TaxID=103816 RepID=UPI0007CD4F35|nr:hypothetical protein [Rhodococcus pyridinivorans]SED51724.1 hypothetical protein SAMN04490240_4088 [Rhodococcus pyridinivorans]